MDENRQRQAQLHGALADAHRLAIIDELAVSDRSPKELSEQLGMATNLLAHHLDVLDRVGLIQRLPSAGDQRRRYIRLCRAPLADLTVATAPRAESVLFVCSHNSARSQLAAALWRARTGHPADSAGTDPATAVHPGAAAAARRAGLDLTNARPRRLVLDETANLVITVCDRAHEELDPPPSWWHWSIPDPVEAGTDTAFDTVIADLDNRIHAVVT